MRQSVDTADQRMNSLTTEFSQILGRRTDDTMTHEESDFEPDVFLDQQPVKFIADGGRNAVELRNPQNQPHSRVQDELKSQRTMQRRAEGRHREKPKKEVKRSLRKTRRRAERETPIEDEERHREIPKEDVEKSRRKT